MATPTPDQPKPIDLRTCGPDDVLVISDGSHLRFGDGLVLENVKWGEKRPEPRNWAWNSPRLFMYHANGNAYGTSRPKIRVTKIIRAPKP